VVLKLLHVARETGRHKAETKKLHIKLVEFQTVHFHAVVLKMADLLDTSH